MKRPHLGDVVFAALISTFGAVQLPGCGAVKADLDCLHFLGPAEAVLSGPIRESSNPAIVGERVIFRVGDGGEGADDPPDRTSGVNVQPLGSGIDCRTFVNPVFTPIESGNIQVVP